MNDNDLSKLLDAPDDDGDRLLMHTVGAIFTTWLAYMSFGALHISDTVFCFYVVAALTWYGVAVLAFIDWYDGGGDGP